MNNVTGWSQLYNGHPVSAVFTMFDAVLSGWFIVLLFLLYLTVLFIKTRSATALTVGSLLFIGLYASQVKAVSLQVIVMVLSFAIAATLFKIIKGD